MLIAILQDGKKSNNNNTRYLWLQKALMTLTPNEKQISNKKE